MSNDLYGSIFQAVKDEFRGTDRTNEEFSDEIDRRMKHVLTVPWSVGFHDRGMGHGDYAVLAEGHSPPVVECGADGAGLAEHIVKAHNAWIERQADE